MRLVPALLIYVCIAMPAWAENRHALIGTNFRETPSYVVDGDTLKMQGGAIRLRGFDTPEKYQPRFFAAATKLEELTMGQVLDCHVRDIGALMVASGLARDYTRYSKGYYKKYEKRVVSLVQ